jgi:hypothetical protein
MTQVSARLGWVLVLVLPLLGYASLESLGLIVLVYRRRELSHMILKSLTVSQDSSFFWGSCYSVDPASSSSEFVFAGEWG